ncbi:MAG TPA: hypothetical protein VNW23_06665 [Opitutaceae bacterium]|nr:hypothetical protein [Opitutaceae bacterium]
MNLFTDEGVEPHRQEAEASLDEPRHPWPVHPKSQFVPQLAALLPLIPAKDDQPAQPFHGEKAGEGAKRDWQLPAWQPK